VMGGRSSFADRPRNGGGARARKARKITLAHDTTVQQGFSVIMRIGVHHLVSNQNAVLNGGGIECLHQMRVALRRLNAALTLFADVIASPRARRIGDDLKWLGSVLGRARDWDVFATGSLKTARRDGTAKLAYESVEQAASAQRLVAHRRVERAIDSARYRSFIRAMNSWLSDDQWRQGVEPDIGAVLEEPLAEVSRAWLRRSARKVRKAGKHVRHLTPKKRHRLRIAAKQLRYDSDSLASLYAAKRVRRYLSALRNLQDVLGDLNDLAVARRLVRVAKRRDRSAVDARLAMAAERRLKALRPAWRAFREIRSFWD